MIPLYIPWSHWSLTWAQLLIISFQSTQESASKGSASGTWVWTKAFLDMVPSTCSAAPAVGWLTQHITVCSGEVPPVAARAFYFCLLWTAARRFFSLKVCFCLRTMKLLRTNSAFWSTGSLWPEFSRTLPTKIPLRDTRELSKFKNKTKGD